MTAQTVRARVQPTQVLAGVVALLLLAYGVYSLVWTGFGGFTGSNHPLLGPFSTNPLLGVVYVAGGVVGALLSWSSATARLFGWVVLVASAVLVAWGLVLVGFTSNNPVSELGNPLNLNVADNWLHLGTGVLGLIVAVLPARRVIVDSADSFASVDEPATEPVAVADPEAPVERQGGASRFPWLHGRSAH